MPYATFFRLPEEKRRRLLDAAWEEFSGVSFAEASINRIIHAADIPRGSFYQYFENKDDLFFFLIETFRIKSVKYLCGMLAKVGGDAFQLPLTVFDELIQSDGSVVPSLAAWVNIFRLNHGINIQQIFGGDGFCRQPPEVLKCVNREGFLRQNDEYVECVLSLLMSALICAAIGTIHDPSKRATMRGFLEEQTEIIRHGALLASMEGAEK